MTESMKDTFERHSPKLYESLPNFKRVVGPIKNEWHIPTMEGVMRADVGDYIIEGLRGEYYPCKPDIFAKSYKPAAQSTEDNSDG